MYPRDNQILENNGWDVECESPFEIRNRNDGSLAQGFAAKLVLEYLWNSAKPLKGYCPECGMLNSLIHDTNNDTIKCKNCLIDLMSDGEDFIRCIERLLDIIKKRTSE